MKRTIFFAATMVLMLALAFSFKGKSVRTVVTHTNAMLTQPRVSNDARVSVNYGNLPLSFEANQGQTDGSVDFIARGDGYSLFLTSNEAVLSLGSLRPDGKTLDSFSALSMSSSEDLTLLGKPWLRDKLARDYNTKLEEQKVAKQATLRMKLVGASDKPRVVGLDELPGKSNYFIGNDPSKWRTNIPTYAKVKYEEVYPGIDLVYYGNQRQLEYDFVVTPGSNPKAITLDFEGADKIEVNADGELVMQIASSYEQIRMHKPSVYQEVEGFKQEVSGSYFFKDNNQLGFQVAEYDVDKPLIIDPVLVYSTFLGGSNDDVGFGIATDLSGNAYVTGYTYSTDFPLANPLQSSFSVGFQHAFVAKINAAGSALVYSTYFGGINGGEEAYGIAVDQSGNAYIAGITGASNFPVVNAAQPTFGGVGDGFVVKLNASGSAIAYSTYLGSTGYDQANSIVVNSNGEAYVVGYTNSTTFPLTSPLQATFAGGSFDVFITKFNAAGSSHVYSTYLGGNGEDLGFGITVDAFGNAYATGRTDSPNFPTASPFQASTGGVIDAFVTKINAGGSLLTYSTYIGGSGIDIGNDIAVDATGNAYITGQTESANFPLANPLQSSFGGSSDAFVTKLNTSGSAPIYSTYLGGSLYDQGEGIAVHGPGNAYVMGYTVSTNFPTVDAIQSVNNGSFDFFLTKFSPAGTALIFSTYYGGINDDQGRALAVDFSGNAYLTGYVSNGFPTVNPLQASFGFVRDAGVVKIFDQPPNQPPNCSGAAIADQNAAANCQATISGEDVTGVTDPDNNDLTITVNPTTLSLGPNSVTVTADDGNGGTCNTIITVNVVDNTAPVPDLANLSDATGECSVTLTAPTATDNCAGSLTATTSDPLTYNTQGPFTVTWTYDDGNGNTSQQTQQVIVDDITPPTLTVSSTPITLWPPNHQYVTINANQCVTAVSDNCNNALSVSDVVITQVTSDEPENGQGDGNTTDDIVITSCNTVDLRRERQGGGNGRVYTIHLQVSDGNGNTSTAACQVHVPKSQNGNSVVDDGPAYTVNSSCVSLTKLSGNFDNTKTPAMIPEGYALEQNYPNPFNPTTEIAFTLPKASELILTIYNIHGQLVRTLVSGYYGAGTYSVRWDAKNGHGSQVANGVYLYVLKAGSFTAQRRLVVMK